MESLRGSLKRIGSRGKVEKASPGLSIARSRNAQDGWTGSNYPTLETSPTTKILVLTMNDSGEVASQALAAGARGLVLKSDAARDLVRAVQSVERGRPFLSPSVTALIIGHLAKMNSPGPSPHDISARELEVLKLLALGRSNKEVAVALDVSVKTVDAHRSNIMRKLALGTYSDLIQFAIRHQIIDI
jgi:DNA-binding NarL/FixJ family response regulator